MDRIAARISLALALLISTLVTSHAFAVALSPRCIAPAGTAPFEFTANGNILRGFIDLPDATGKHPAIVIVHGSGGTNVTQGDEPWNGSYGEMRAAFRSAGIATVVWDKAGNGCSEGHYLHVDDVYARANEVVSAVKALQARNDIDAARIGAWGISQGGWIVPMAAVRSRDIKFMILVSGPGKDFFSTWGYQALNQLRTEHVPEKEARAAVSAMQRAITVMRAGGTYEEFTKASQPLLEYPVFGEQLGITGGTAETYAMGVAPEFMRIWTTSADTYLSELDVPLLALFGDHDDKVDWRESVRTYREAYAHAGNRDLTIKVFKNASHDLFAIDPAKTPAQNPPAPQLAPGYLTTMVAWLRARNFAKP